MGVWTQRGAYGYVAFMFAAAVLKLSFDLNREVVVEDYLWRLFWVVAATGWALRLLHKSSRQESQEATLAYRDSGVVLATLTIVGVAVL